MFSKSTGKFLFMALMFILGAIACTATVCGYVGVEFPVLSFLSGPDIGITLMFGGAIVAPFPVDPELTPIAVAYKNKKYIADKIFPRKPVGLQSFKYRSYPKGLFLTIPETLVGRTGIPNRVELSFTELDSSTLDHTLDDGVPIVDIVNAPKGYNPLAAAVEYLTNLIELDREMRAATLAFDADQYAAANKATLSGTSQFSHASSTPIATLTAAMDACFYTPTKWVMGRAVWRYLSQHAEIVKAVNGTLGDTGIVRLQQMAELFEIDEIIVGESKYNSANPGQTVVTGQLWGKSLLMFSDDPTAMPNAGVTFGMTAEFGNRTAGVIDDKDMGMRGGKRVRVGESVRELITANDLGYLLSEAVA
ncbi:MAG: phage capsid protein [Candidatus Paceibacterota bacterium]|jgi:hypothetical protein